ncbi:NADH-quinone oxidoreductase subunit C [Streptomyces sp. NPDC059349]|uniref:NADH-quinone oxidoreductase subunit C n=1 Tax=Streptomyces sp. NPDC059349 TaxID=3346808 RepID=UPI00367BF988
MTGWLPRPVEEIFGPDATAEESYEVLTVDVPAATWIAALETARTTLGCTYFDWLSAVDEPGTGFRVCAHVVALSPVRRLLLRTTVPHDAPVLATAVDVYAGAGWHERETHEMFGVRFEGHPHLVPLLLPDGFEGHPLRKDFVLAARVVKAWPGAKEPGESAGHGAPKRRQMLPPGVPDPNEWGPQKGQLPPAPARPARGAARAAGDRPVRRTRTAGEGSASQATPAGTDAAAAAPPRRSRSASQGSASQTPPTPEAPATPEAPVAPEAPAAPESPAAPKTPAAPKPDAAGSKSGGTGDAPWHHARPAFDEPKPAAPEEPTPETPDAPDDAPDTPAPSEAPEAPATSEAPDAPATSEAPDAPATSEAPDAPATSEAPDAPATSEAPDAPATPEAPDAPATPEAPETPSGGTE